MSFTELEAMSAAQVFCVEGYLRWRSDQLRRSQGPSVTDDGTRVVESWSADG